MTPTDDRAPAIPGLRVERLADPESVGEDAELAEALRQEIRERGPITFARFMARALYEPGHGYYRRDEPGPGRAGDFITAPETHPIFGAVVGRLVVQAWEAFDRPSPFTVTEPGAGTGAMAASVLSGLRDDASPLLEAIRYRPVDVESARLVALGARLEADGLAAALDNEPAPPERVETGAVIANEVLDALPVHLVVGRPDGPHELLVAVDAQGAFATIEAELTTPAIAARLDEEGVTLADGQRTEVCLAVDDWLAGVTRHLARGIVVLIDYADEPAALYGPGRPTGTLRAFARHAVGADPFRHVGRQDITATVDLAAVRGAARGAGLTHLGETTAGELLAAAGDGLAARYLERPGASLQDVLTLRSALARLLDPRGLGGFRVLAFGRGFPPSATLGALRRIVPPR
jgi:SAM-dependent MidA family methyltransferase